ncbi:MAG: nuclear transport factor 2 family protein [Candidatus Latescibacteria bacterium]|jgi:ketosteroid isomerase-like protein|nr:nuclear transport factor 2 family protein [Candidatus Latescibacterota bacterium]
MSSNQTEETLAHHLAAVGAGDMGEILSDYTEDSVLLTVDGTMIGLEAIRGFFERFSEKASDTFMEKFDMKHQVCDGEVAFIVWCSGTEAPLGTDTFVIRDGKIVIQTYAAYFI